MSNLTLPTDPDNHGFYSLHTHTRYSRGDATGSVRLTVAKAKELGYSHLGLTDHGTLSGAVQFYKACRKADIEPLIGVEAYLLFDRHVTARQKLYHGLLVAYDLTGYRNLVSLVSQSWRQHRWYPTLDLADLAQAASSGRLEGILMTGGCWFGLMPRLLRENPSEHLLNIFEALSAWFDGRFFVEIHNHGIELPGQSDRDQAMLLHNLAVANHLPSALMQDSHYTEASQQSLHDTFKMLTSYNTDDPSEAVFPGDGYHLVDTEWMRRHHHPTIFRRGMAGLDMIRDLADLRIPELEHYRLRTPDLSVAGSAQTDLSKRAKEALAVKTELSGWSTHVAKRYRDRLSTELGIVKETGFAGYLLLVAKVCAWMLEQGIRFSVRGSAVGSMLVWLLDITNIDPLHWGLSFDRFISTDRIKPPDIDLDIEHERRGEVITMMLEQFDAVQIGTFAQYGMSEDDSGDLNGLLMVEWKKRARALGAEPDAGVPDHWRAQMTALQYINGQRGKLSIEAPIRSIGVHAAGVLIAPSQAELDEVPIQYVTQSKTFVTAYDQHDVEELGLVKLDLLGLRTLTTLRVCEEMTGIRHDELVTTDRAVFASMSDTTGLFQLEGGSSTRGIKRMRPTKIADVIAAMALFRPATQQSGATDSYLRRRRGEEIIAKRHPLIEAHLHGTYGVMIYQEQVLGILKDIGLTVGEVEAARKAIKASNANIGDAGDVLDGLMSTIMAKAEEHGLDSHDQKWLTDALHAYAEYSFNQAHATAYGLIAYATAWYRLHRPVAFWTGLLRANHDKAPRYKDSPKPEHIYLKAAHKAGMTVRPPHVNHSGLSYSSDGVHIYKGLTTIPGVGGIAAAAIAEKAPFTSLDDFARRCPTKQVTGTRALGKGTAPVNCPGVVRLLHVAGALEDLERETTTTKESHESGQQVQQPV